MKKFRYFILVLAGVAAMMLGGCKDKEKYDESAFQDDLEPLSEDEVEAMDQNGDDEMAVADESDLEQLQDSENAAGSGDTDGSASSDAADSQSEKKLDENGTYTDKDEVAQYIYEYGHVPSNLTAADYDNADSMLPVVDPVTYRHCSRDDAGKQKQNIYRNKTIQLYLRAEGRRSRRPLKGGAERCFFRRHKKSSMGIKTR